MSKETVDLIVFTIACLAVVGLFGLVSYCMNRLYDRLEKAEEDLCEANQTINSLREEYEELILANKDLRRKLNFKQYQQENAEVKPHK